MKLDFSPEQILSIFDLIDMSHVQDKREETTATTDTTATTTTTTTITVTQMVDVGVQSTSIAAEAHLRHQLAAYSTLVNVGLDHQGHLTAGLPATLLTPLGIVPPPSHLTTIPSCTSIHPLLVAFLDSQASQTLPTSTAPMLSPASGPSSFATPTGGASRTSFDSKSRMSISSIGSTSTHKWSSSSGSASGLGSRGSGSDSHFGCEMSQLSGGFAPPSISSVNKSMSVDSGHKTFAGLLAVATTAQDAIRRWSTGRVSSVDEAPPPPLIVDLPIASPALGQLLPLFSVSTPQRYPSGPAHTVTLPMRASIDSMDSMPGTSYEGAAEIGPRRSLSHSTSSRSRYHPYALGLRRQMSIGGLPTTTEIDVASSSSIVMGEPQRILGGTAFEERRCHTCWKIVNPAKPLSALLNHAKRHYTLKQFVCTVCDYSSSESAHVRNHMKQRHQIDNVHPGDQRDHSMQQAWIDVACECFPLAVQQLQRFRFKNFPRRPIAPTRSGEGDDV